MCCFFRKIDIYTCIIIVYTYYLQKIYTYNFLVSLYHIYNIMNIYTQISSFLKKYK